MKNPVLDPVVQTLHGTTARDHELAGEFGCALEERHLRTEAADVFVDLKKDFVVLEEARPVALRVRVERMVASAAVPLDDHVLYVWRISRRN